VRRRALVLALLLLGAPWRAAAQEAAGLVGPVELTVGARAWYASGNLTWGFAGTILGGPVKPLSELRWRGVDALVSEVSVDVVWRRLVLSGAFGRADDRGGVLIDDDFALDDHRGRFAHTRSTVEGDLSYARGDIGARVVRWGEGRRGWLDVLIGYQYWHEKLEAFGLQGFVDLSPFGIPLQLPAVAQPNLKVITHDYYFNSLRVGTRTQVPLAAGFALRARATVLPYSSFRLDDVHHLRTDLKKNPSFRSEQTGGLGVQAAGGLAYAWGPLSVEAGFEFWHLHAGRGGEKTARLRSGDLNDRLTELSVERAGPYLALQYRF
jgi:hypothetical protein